MNTQRDPVSSTTRGLWRWPVAVLLAFPIGGLFADLAVNGVDSPGAALAEGLISGAVVGAVEWFALRRWVSWFWIPATCIGLAVGLTVGAVLVDYSIERSDLALMGAATGLAVGVMQGLVLMQAGHRFSSAVLWAVANPPAWALAWVVSSYVIARNIGERFPTFGASGCIVFGLLTWALLAFLIRTKSGARQTTEAAAR